MEIILLEKVQNMGEIGDLVKVRNGYARNYLIPQKKAMLATAEAKAEVETRRRQLAQDEGQRLAQAQARAEQAVREISLTRLCGEEGQLYGSVSPIDIAEAMSETGVEIEKSEITQPDGPIKHIGEFEADVILHPEVRFTVKINVDGEQSEDPVEAAADPDNIESPEPDSDGGEEIED
jgi:large subunit ribosomal protein L9